MAATGTAVKGELHGSLSAEAARVAFILAWVAGGVDAVGYLTLSHLFTAHMSGNSVAAGTALGQGDWTTLLARGLPIVFFVVGIAIGSALGELRRARGARHPFAAVYVAEAALLGAFWAAGTRWLPDGSVAPSAGSLFFAFAALPTFAMGVQNATIGRVGRLGVHTTYMTGVLTNLVDAFVQMLFRSGAPCVPNEHSGPSPRDRIRLYGGLWAGYSIGAAVGAFGQARWGFAILVLPIAGLGVAAARDVLKPHDIGAPDGA